MQLAGGDIAGFVRFRRLAALSLESGDPSGSYYPPPLRLAGPFDLAFAVIVLGGIGNIWGWLPRA